jgi:hypothetical protein
MILPLNLFAFEQLGHWSPVQIHESSLFLAVIFNIIPPIGSNNIEIYSGARFYG